MRERGQDRGSMLLVEECFAGEDSRFVEELRRVDNLKLLAAFAERWKHDPRPWARQQMFAYLDLPLDRPGHQPIVKRLFKQAEEDHDDELMARFLVAFDRNVRRVISNRWVWNSSLRGGSQVEVLATARDVIPLPGNTYIDPATGSRVPKRVPRNGHLFKYRTRYYLRRRAWRYFRKIGFGKPEAYPAAISRALALYRDEDFPKGENILDSWSLMHACFGEHPALEFGADHPKLKESHSFSELSSAPAFPDTWKKPESAPLLFNLLFQAQSRLIRVWARQSLERDHASHTATVEELLQLLDHDDAEVQQFGARLLANAPGLATMPVSSWLRLLQTRNTEALALICEVFLKHVSSERLSLAQMVELACTRPVPVARLGLRFLQGRTIQSAEERAAITGVADTRCGAVAGDLTAWALGILGQRDVYLCDQVVRFFDSLQEEAREAAWNWLIAENSPGLDDPVLWSRLIETPFPDLRLRIVDFLERESERRASLPQDLKSLWTTVLLGVHRGGRQKAKAVRQIGEAIVNDAAHAESLLPVLAVAVRSVRSPEARAGLAAVMTALERRPELAELVHRFLPELNWMEVPA
jgi:hypothetical protein